MKKIATLFTSFAILLCLFLSTPTEAAETAGINSDGEVTNPELLDESQTLVDETGEEWNVDKYELTMSESYQTNVEEQTQVNQNSISPMGLLSDGSVVVACKDGGSLVASCKVTYKLFSDLINAISTTLEIHDSKNVLEDWKDINKGVNPAVSTVYGYADLHVLSKGYYKDYVWGTVYGRKGAYTVNHLAAKSFYIN